MKYKPIWPKKRVRQIATLRELLREVKSIDSGNSILWRLKKIIRLADDLYKSDRDLLIKPFPDFLEDEAWKEVAIVSKPKTP